jgi:hypothetical protein
MQNVEVTLIAILLLLGPTPSVADVGSELARCELEAQRVLPAPPNAENVETCMRAAGYKPITECSAPLKTYESCMKIADEIMRGPSANQYRDADWNRICLANEWDVQSQKRLSADCYQSSSW